VDVVNLIHKEAAAMWPLVVCLLLQLVVFVPLLLQVFHSLLKAHAVEARAVVRQALEILTPAMPGRMEDGNVCRRCQFIVSAVFSLYIFHFSSYHC